MSENKYNALKIENQICFPLYAGSRELIKKYSPALKEIDLTYTQYITMLVLWEEKQMTARDLGAKLYLDSGTLTPLLKKLEAKGYITRRRDSLDERCLVVTLTDAGAKLRDKALAIPAQVKGCLDLTEEEYAELYRLLYKILESAEAEE